MKWPDGRCINHLFPSSTALKLPWLLMKLLVSILLQNRNAKRAVEVGGALRDILRR